MEVFLPVQDELSGGVACLAVTVRPDEGEISVGISTDNIGEGLWVGLSAEQTHRLRVILNSFGEQAT